MTENILSLEDLKFLEQLHYKQGMKFLRCDDEGVRLNVEALSGDEDINYLNEISKKLKFRLDSNFQLNFSSNFQFDVVRI